MLVLVDGGELAMLKAFLNHTAQNVNPVLELWTAGPNSNTPGETDVLGDYTLVTGSGYANKTLTGSSFTFSGTNPTTATYASQTFTFNAALGSAVQGYLVKVSTTLL